MTSTRLLKKNEAEEKTSPVFKFFSLPEDCALQLPTFLELKDVATLSQLNKSTYQLFKPMLSNSLLKFVVRGWQEDAEILIQKNPSWLLKKGTVTDYSGRTFKDITALQYAIWARDRSMVNMLLKHMPKQDALDQWNEMALVSFKSQQGAHYDFTPLLNAMQAYVTYTTTPGNTSISQAKQLALEVGKLQRLVPVHVANFFCSSDYPNCKTVSRSLFLHKAYRSQETWYSLSGSLGVTRTFYRACAGGLLIAHDEDNNWIKGAAFEIDLKHLRKFDATRTEEFSDIKNNFLTPKSSCCILC